MSIPVLQTPLTLPVLDAGLPFSAVIAATNNPTAFTFTPASGISGISSSGMLAVFTVLTGPLPASLGGSDSPATVTLGTIAASNSDGTSTPATLTAQVRPMVATSGSPGLSGDGTDFWITGGPGKITNPRTNPDIFAGHGVFDSDFFFAVLGSDSNVYYGWINADVGYPSEESTYLYHRYFVVWVTTAPPVITTGTDTHGANNTYGTVIATGTQLTPCVADTVPNSITGLTGTYITATLIAGIAGGNAGNEGRTFTGTVASSGLPSGLSLNGSNQIVGMPAAGGTSFATVSATQGGITYPLYMVIAIAVGAIPVVATTYSGIPFFSGWTFTIYAAEPVSIQLTASNSPTAWSATGLPSGLSIDNTGLISGTPSATGASSISVTATNGAGSSAPASFIITITNGPVPAITSGSRALGTVGTALGYQITASNSPTSFAAAGFPTGLSINTSTGLISGTPTGAGTSPVTVSATNGNGTGTATVTFTIYAAPAAIPVILSGPYAYLSADNPAQGILLGAGPGTLDPGTDVPVVNDSTKPPVILRGPYTEIGSAAKPGIILGAVAPGATPVPAGSGSGLGGGILAPDGWYYVTPYLRYSGGSPPQEQTLIGESWVTDRSIS
jgi:hypothetical protein